MIYARPAEPFDAVLEGAPEGLVGTVAVRVVATPAGDVIVPRTTGGIVETVPGVYVASITVPADVADPSLLVVWDLGDPDDSATTYTEALYLTSILGPVVQYDGGGIALDATAVVASTASLLRWRLRQRGFGEGRGGEEVPTFTTGTTPSVTTATEVVQRNSALVSDDFPHADASDEPELRTIAALRSAIELELGVDQPDFERVREWRNELREHVSRVAESAESAEDEAAGARALDAQWGFGPVVDEPVMGAEEPLDYSRRRLRW